MEPAVAVVIPALDEEASIGGVVEAVRREVSGVAVIVVDNGSRDRTAEVAQQAGATVIAQPRRGYGWACRAGCDAAARSDAAVIVFLDGDGSMPAESIPALLAPILAGVADVVCGARTRHRAPMPWHQRAGNRVIGLQLRMLYGLRLRELGPFRAVRASTLAALELPGSRYAWAAQLLARAARNGARVVEVDVGYRQRTGGRSKVGGTVKGSLLAAWDISKTLMAERVR